VNDATNALAFYKSAFGAIELERLDDDAGNVVLAGLSIDGADFWIQTDAASSPQALNGISVRMILTVDDPDPIFAQAISAGAQEVAAMHEDHGWRIGRLADPFGHHWEVGRRLP
jgi:PhnB protein